ncbi:MarR family winged helix-turn-helix transcriptional regulator [Halanaerobium salsuginis]|jgi:DNA-binding MarR family transcriptional regulator|uniref:HTH-type transcriptional regulator MgrA n=1 Tax=Halanaerobium salsuginis TaxID=29563 RepID=A0A1I4J1G2_9FIRM|nr:MarR family transcriptional regulator [Halanaerobium salsuginis]SFL59971.1 DNA-binding transcriptional regulator, MarR family [Halanaerobium salsuginis]
MYIEAPIGKWIAKLYKDHDQFVDQLLEKYNLNHSEGNILIYLFRDGDGINQKTLQENLGVDKATISRAIRSLLLKEYLKKETSPTDGRVNLIYLTDKARSRKPLINNIYQEWFRKFLDDISEEDARTVLKTLQKMYQVVQN